MPIKIGFDDVKCSKVRCDGSLESEEQVVYCPECKTEYNFEIQLYPVRSP